MNKPPIQNLIYEVRGVSVMIDSELAGLYGIETKRLKEAVRRNIERFRGEDFMFEMTNDEVNRLTVSSRSQIASLNGGRGSNVKYMPFAFTELGVAMLSSVLHSPMAIEINRNIMRAFVAMRQYVTTATVVTAELAEIRARLELLERNDEDHLEAMNDLSEDTRREIDNLYAAIAALSVKPQGKPREPIGYKTGGR